MPKGKKKAKADEEIVTETETSTGTSVASGTEVVGNAKEEEVEESKAQEEKEEVARELPPLEGTQQYFEAPDGTVLVGEKSATRLWYRRGNGGAGIYINPMRRTEKP